MVQIGMVEVEQRVIRRRVDVGNVFRIFINCDVSVVVQSNFIGYEIFLSMDVEFIEVISIENMVYNFRVGGVS